MDVAAQEKIERRLKALIAADFEKFNAGLNASTELCNALKEDFRDALERFVADQPSGFARRAVVRCFGSLIDGLTASMRFAAIALCEVFDEPLNPFLQEKTAERHISTHQRIYSIYRLIAEFAPRSPLSHLPDSRWDDLRRALEIRNRVLHPATTSDLDLPNDQMRLIVDTGHNFYRDYTQFVQWFGRKGQQMLWEVPGTRRRLFKKIGRNEPCPCGSQRKFKNCCGGSPV
jgi:hypothetical protein